MYSLVITRLLHDLIRLMDHLDMSTSSLPGEPFCSISPLTFSMYALEHLEGVQGRRSLVAPPEKSVLASVDMRMEVFGSLVHHALKKVGVFNVCVCECATRQSSNPRIH